MSLETLKALVKTAIGTCNRIFGLELCIKGKSIVNRMEHFGDNQDILSDDNINAELRAKPDKYSEIYFSRFCK